MPYPNCKVYSDGSHYIAIPHTTKIKRRRKRKIERLVEVAKELEEALGQEEVGVEESVPSENDGTPILREERKDKSKQQCTELVPLKEAFERLYKANLSLSKGQRRKAIFEGLKGYFEGEEKAWAYVKENMERKWRNLLARRIRLTRKVNLQEFNYFCTFTYDNALHTEESFKKKLKDCFKKMCYRRSWKYIGVWERSPEKKRLHFHGLFNIPEGGMPSELEGKKDYSFHTHKREEIHQSIYFRERFGRNDFERIEERERLGDAVAYLVKYIEKTGEKIVYSKGIAQFFISDILDDDVVCTIGTDDKKLLLFDDFYCLNEGEIIGTVSAETISKMKKSN